MNIKVSEKNRLFFQLFFICFYRILLDYIYLNGLVPTYGYIGLMANGDSFSGIINWVSFLVTAFVLVCATAVQPITFSKTVVYSLFLLIYTPFSILSAYRMLDSSFVIANNIYWLIFLLALLFLSKKSLQPKPTFVMNKTKMGEKTLYFFILFSLILIFYLSWRFTGFRISFNIETVYELRSEAANFSLPSLIKYFFNWTRVLNCFLFCLSLIRNKKIIAILIFISSVLSFGIDGMKTSMFMIFLDIFLFILYKYRFYSNSYNLILFGFNMATIIAGLEMLVLKTKLLISFLYRMEFLPVLISSWFFDFFTTNEPDYFRGSFLRFLGFSSPYEKMNYMISGLYGGDFNSEANNGLISDAITNMGYIGIVIMPIIVVLFLKLFDRFSQGINQLLVLTLGLYCALILSNMFLLPCLLTGGWLLMLVVLMFIDKDKDQAEFRIFERKGRTL